MGMMGKLGQSPYHVGLHGNRILFALAEVIIGWRLLVNAKVALAAQAGGAERDRPFYAGKVAAARFFAREVLPASPRRKIIEGGDLALMERPTTRGSRGQPASRPRNSGATAAATRAQPPGARLTA
jgi:hypothetical protein